MQMVFNRNVLAIENKKLIFWKSVSTQGFRLSFYKVFWEDISLVCIPVVFLFPVIVSKVVIASERMEQVTL